jgi:MFS-type transporter involved in bile tolerance (Atg22 family)
VTISIGLVLMTAVLICLYIFPPAMLLTPVTKLPLVGIPLVEGGPRMLTLAGVLLMFAGVAWAFVNINSLPMVVDMTSAARIGTYTGLYYLFSTLSAIVGPNVNGWIIQLTSGNYNNIMLFAPIFMVIALVLMWGVRRGEAHVV